MSDSAWRHSRIGLFHYSPVHAEGNMTRLHYVMLRRDVFLKFGSFPPLGEWAGVGYASPPRCCIQILCQKVSHGEIFWFQIQICSNISMAYCWTCHQTTAVVNRVRPSEPVHCYSTDDAKVKPEAGQLLSAVRYSC